MSSPGGWVGAEAYAPTPQGGFTRRARALASPVRLAAPFADALVPTVLRGNAVPDALRPLNDDPRGGRGGASQDGIPTEDRGNELKAGQGHRHFGFVRHARGPRRAT